MTYSLKTLAGKHKSTRSKIIKKYGYKELNFSFIIKNKIRILSQNFGIKKNYFITFSLLINLFDIRYIMKSIYKSKLKIKYLNFKDIW